ncbi:MAG: hypothetical protein N3B10_13570 [Armatimonadetes bacterium]|nr:hypothetical protein [Armatimonadota bacterium]
MAFWGLVVLTAILSLARFKPLRKQIGTNQAVAISALRLFAIATAALLALPISLPSHQTITQPIRLAILVDASASTNTPTRQKVIGQLKRELRFHSGSVLIWEFAEDLKPVPLEELSEHAEGSASHLSEAILKVIEAVKPDELLIISDAQDTNPKPDAEISKVLRGTKTRLNLLLLPTYLPPNLSLKISPVQSFLFAGEKVNFTVQVRNEGFAGGTKVKLRVWDANKLLFQSRLTITAGIEQTTVTLSPQRTGWHRYRFEVSLDEGEVWTTDNVAEALVWQSPTKLRVLLVTGQPSFEFKFVKQAIESEPNFEWAAIASLPDGTRYQQGSPNLLPVSLMRLEPFHALVVLAPTPYEFGSAEGKSAWQFVQSGGGLLVTLSEPTVRTNGWRFFVPVTLSISRLPPNSQLSPASSDFVVENLPLVESAWSIQPQLKFFHVGLHSGGKPILVWWQEGLGKVALLGVDGTWKWVMDAARKGEEPFVHRLFWRTLVRFLADPMKGIKDEKIFAGGQLRSPEPPPPELTYLPQGWLKRWAETTGGQILRPDELKVWLKSQAQAKRVKVATQYPLSALFTPYLLLIATLTIEWWLVRRSGLQ